MMGMGLANGKRCRNGEEPLEWAAKRTCCVPGASAENMSENLPITIASDDSDTAMADAEEEAKEDSQSPPRLSTTRTTDELSGKMKAWIWADTPMSLFEHLCIRPEDGPDWAALLGIVAQEYWTAQREYDFFSFDVAADVQGPRPLVSPLLRMARCRRAYAQLDSRMPELPPGFQTYEPPRIADPDEVLYGAPQQSTGSAQDLSGCCCLQPQETVKWEQDVKLEPPVSARPLPPSSTTPVVIDLTGEDTVDEARAAGAEPKPVGHAPDANGDAPITAAPITEPTLCPEQARLVDLAASGRNIFYTGSAGCGKSTVLHAIRKRLKEEGKEVQVMAPTGKAALAVGGTTTWTFAGLTPDHNRWPLDKLMSRAMGKIIRKRFAATDVIIIDEISMVENLHFERINEVMKAGRRSARPFGGVQVIVTGDFCQLPPVKPFKHCIDCGAELRPDAAEENYTCPKVKCRRTYRDVDKWAFRSAAWAECNFEHVHLTTIHRQSDERFIKLLQKCRLGVPFTQEEEDLLMHHPTPKTANAVQLFSTREEVRDTNARQFARLKTPAQTYSCLDSFVWDAKKHPYLEPKGRRAEDGSLRALEEHRFEARLSLKQGMSVVLLVNLDMAEGLCNGSQGIVCGWEDYDINKLPRKTEGSTPHATLKNTQVSHFMERLKNGDAAGATSNKPGASKPPSQQPTPTPTPSPSRLCWPVVRFHNGLTRTIYAECMVHELGYTEPYSLLCRTQVPLAAAWALSIHKAQGMTLDRVIVNLSRAFEVGQAYVALSRATSLEGLRIAGDVRGLRVSKNGNEEVRAFMREKFGI